MQDLDLDLKLPSHTQLPAALARPVSLPVLVLVVASAQAAAAECGRPVRTRRLPRALLDNERRGSTYTQGRLAFPGEVLRATAGEVGLEEMRGDANVQLKGAID